MISLWHYTEMHYPFLKLHSLPTMKMGKDKKPSPNKSHEYTKNAPLPTSPKSQRAGFRGVALFVDGCFWHGCPKHSNMPKNNRAFWKKKLQGNVERDKNVSRQLKKQGWKVVRVWEHELRSPEKVVGKVQRALTTTSILGA